MHTLDDLISIRQSFARELNELDQPEPGTLWQYGLWVVTMQTIIELDKLIDEWSQSAKDECKRTV
jgi:hypothetical protein